MKDSDWLPGLWRSPPVHVLKLLREAARVATVGAMAENREPKLRKDNMAAARYRPIAFVLLVAIALAMASVPTEALSDVDGHVGDDTCCAHDDGPLAHASSAPVDEDCCPSGCKDCFLSCCGGPVSSSTSSVVLDLRQDSTGSVTPDSDDFSLSHPTEIFHPPRF